MKNNSENIIYKSLLLLFIFLNISCSDEIIERTDSFMALNPTNSNLNAGTWKTILLTKPDEFSLEAPISVSSAAFLREINEIKSYQASLTQDQERIIKYWSVGGVLRWNEIMRTLVARHNRPPYQNQDGTYPAPSAANPFANPQFPFSNPPYAARAYAYVSAAQYDALVAAWHYKALYNRAAPFTVDSNIKVLIPKSNLPSYPSEDGVLSGVTVALLKMLFPTEIAYIQAKAEEQELSRILSGANVRSDVEAGVSLGRAIAAKFITRAASDGAGAAIGDQAYWTQLEVQTIALGEIPWKSLELPVRPPMLPKFGKVKSFFMTSEMVVSSRPIPPPSTNSAQFLKELNEVKNYSKNTNKKNMEMVSFWADGVGTYTPPGHWNAIAVESFEKQNYSEVMWARNLALLNIAMMDAAISCWDAKYYYFNPRPCQMDSSIKTLTGNPNFPAYVSGHSTFSGAAAIILAHLIPSKAQYFQEQAKEASDSRMFGGIHYRSDCEQGLILGKVVGDFAVDRAKIDGAE